MEWEEALGLLRTMWRIRQFEERVGQLKRADEVHGLIHLSVGQEAVAAGVCSQLQGDDAVYSGHRAHGPPPRPGGDGPSHATGHPG